MLLRVSRRYCRISVATHSPLVLSKIIIHLSGSPAAMVNARCCREIAHLQDSSGSQVEKQAPNRSFCSSCIGSSLPPPAYVNCHFKALVQKNAPVVFGAPLLWIYYAGSRMEACRMYACVPIVFWTPAALAYLPGSP